MCETKRVAKMFFFNEVEKAKRTVGKLEKLKETPHRPRLGKLILKSKATGSGSGRLQWQVAVAGCSGRLQWQAAGIFFMSLS